MYCPPLRPKQEVPPSLKWNLQNDEPVETLYLGHFVRVMESQHGYFYTVLFSLCSSAPTGPLPASDLNAFPLTKWTVRLSISIFRLITVFIPPLSSLPLLKRPCFSLVKPSLPSLERTHGLCQVWVHGNDVTALAQWESLPWKELSLLPWFANRRWTGCRQTYATPSDVLSLSPSCLALSCYLITYHLSQPHLPGSLWCSVKQCLHRSPDYCLTFH